MVIRPWIARHSAWLLDRFRIRANGRSSYHDTTGCEHRGDRIKFGKAALFRYSLAASDKAAKRKQFSKADLRFDKGGVGGRIVYANEYLLGTTDGVFSSRTTKRLTAADQVDKRIFQFYEGCSLGQAMRGA